MGFPRWCGSKESACQSRRCRFDPWVGKIPWRRKWQPTTVFLPGESHGQRSLVGYSHGVTKSQTWLRTQTALWLLIGHQATLSIGEVEHQPPPRPSLPADLEQSPWFILLLLYASHCSSFVPVGYNTCAHSQAHTYTYICTLTIGHSPFLSLQAWHPCLVKLS